MAKRPPFGVNLPPTMEAFLAQLVREGRAQNPREALRGLVWQEMKRWEDMNRKPFPTVEGEAQEGEGED